MRRFANGLAGRQVVVVRLGAKSNIAASLAAAHIENALQSDLVGAQLAGEKVSWRAALLGSEPQELSLCCLPVKGEIEDRKAVRWVPATASNARALAGQRLVADRQVPKGIPAERLRRQAAYSGEDRGPIHA